MITAAVNLYASYSRAYRNTDPFHTEQFYIRGIYATLFFKQWENVIQIMNVDEYKILSWGERCNFAFHEATAECIRKLHLSLNENIFTVARMKIFIICL